MQRLAFAMKLLPGFEAEYQKRHDEIWPELARELTAAGVSDYSIYLDPESLTLFAVVVTANHYWIDAVAGAACVLLALAWATPMVRWSQQHRARRLQRRRDSDEIASTTAEPSAPH